MGEFYNSIKRYVQSVDISIFIISIVCSLMGMALIYSATGNGGFSRNVLVQGIAVIVGIVLMIIISKVDYEVYITMAKIIFPICFIALLVTYFVATPIKGNRNWINFGFINFQTSEFTKIGFLLTISAHINHIKEEIDSPKNVFLLFLHLLGYLFPIVLQGDVGSALVYVFMFIVILFTAGLSLKYFAGALISLGALAPVIWTYALNVNRKSRILITFNPDLDPLGYGYQQIQSRMTLGSGRLWGSGLFKGIQTQFGLLPEKHTDFIFAVAGEEIGFIGCLTIIVLLSLLLFRIMRLSFSSRDSYGSFICIGVFSMLLFQTVENIGMCLALLPVIGITLPLFSYGGSSILSVFLALGLVQSVKIRSHSLNFKIDY